MIISIASDHAGFEQKQALAGYLADRGYEVIDRGPETDERVDYPDYAAAVAHDVSRGVADRGVLVCGTGIGNKKIVDAFLATKFEGGRHAMRVAKIMKLDAEGGAVIGADGNVRRN